MTDKEMTNEELEKMREDFFMPQATNDFGKIICFKCKPTYNFQSIEFEWYGTKNDVEEMFDIYKTLLNELMVLAPEQPARQVEKVAAAKKPPVEMPTEKMYSIMDHFKIPYTSKTTKAEAQQLIADNIAKCSK